MSYLRDKVECRSCGMLYDPDLLRDGDCRDCETYDPRDHYDGLDRFHYAHDDSVFGEGGV